MTSVGLQFYSFYFCILNSQKRIIRMFHEILTICSNKNQVFWFQLIDVNWFYTLLYEQQRVLTLTLSLSLSPDYFAIEVHIWL